MPSSSRVYFEQTSVSSDILPALIFSKKLRYFFSIALTVNNAEYAAAICGNNLYCCVLYSSTATSGFLKIHARRIVVSHNHNPGQYVMLLQISCYLQNSSRTFKNPIRPYTKFVVYCYVVKSSTEQRLESILNG